MEGARSLLQYQIGVRRTLAWLEHGQYDVLARLKRDVHFHADEHRVRRAVYDVGHHANAFLEIDQSQHIGRLEGFGRRLMNNRKMRDDCSTAGA